MRDILISIHPQHCKNIFEGKKTVELRKSRPKIKAPFKCMVYETAKNGGAGMIIGEFICVGFFVLQNEFFTSCEFFRSCERFAMAELACVKNLEMRDYANGRLLYGWDIRNPVKYEKPIKLTDYNITRPPQSWQYVSECDISKYIETCEDCGFCGKE